MGLIFGITAAIILIFVLVFHVGRFFLYQRQAYILIRTRTEREIIETKRREAEVQTFLWRESMSKFICGPGETMALKNHMTGELSAFQGGQFRSVPGPISADQGQSGGHVMLPEHTAQTRGAVGTDHGQFFLDSGRNAVEMLKDSARIWVIGNQGAGKTNFLRHMADCFSDTEKIVIIDSHDHVRKWGQFEVVGSGRDYAKITRFLAQILEEINNRYKIYSETENPCFDTVRIIADEWTLIPKKCKSIMEKFTDSFFTEGRKVGFNFLFASHSDRAELTGFSGKKDIFKTIDAHVKLQNTSGQRSAVIDFGDGPENFEMPGVYAPIKDPVGDAIVGALGERNLSRSDLFRVFSNNVQAGVIDRSVKKLIESGAINITKKSGGVGRPKTVFSLAERNDIRRLN